jgi:serine/threonine-protein kinase
LGDAVEPGNTLGGRYQLVERVGAGGAGEVWRALDEMLDRTVAVKVLRPDLAQDSGTVRRFAAEARIMARLNHPGIAAVFDFGKDPDGTAYLVMRFVQGEALRAMVERSGSIPVAQTMDVVAAAAAALAAAHEADIIHRDVKPGNLMVRADGSVVLTDFGIARAAGNDLTGAGLVLGTARYLAPEQAAGEELTPAIDIYALGVTAYECLTGRPPFDGPNPVEVAMRHIESTAPPLPKTLPEPVRALVSAMMSKDPERRPTASEVAEAARGAAEAGFEPEFAKPGGWEKQRRKILAGAAAGVTAVLASFALTAFGNSGAPPGKSVDSVPIGGGLGMARAATPDNSNAPLLPPVITPGQTSPGRVLPAYPLPPANRGSTAVPPGGPPGGTSPTAGTPPTTPAPDPTPAPSSPPPPLVTVPNVVGMLEADAVAAIVAANLAPNVAYVDSACRGGPVTAQVPESGEVAPNSQVTITVGKAATCP